MAEGTKEDVDLAVKAARNAFDHGPWPRLSGEVCCAYMYIVRWYYDMVTDINIFLL